jgi:hypothetical protein
MDRLKYCRQMLFNSRAYSVAQVHSREGGATVRSPRQKVLVVQEQQPWRLGFRFAVSAVSKTAAQEGTMPGGVGVAFAPIGSRPSNSHLEVIVAFRFAACFLHWFEGLLSF